MNLFAETDDYSVEHMDSHDEWLQSRGRGIGGSDAAALVGCSRFKTLQDLWAEKVRGERKPVEGPFVEYGKICEPALRTLWKAKHLDQQVQYEENACLVSKKRSWMRYSPDGLIWVPESGRRGILEIKTSLIRNSKKLHEWQEGVPIEYYLQVLHGLLVTGFDFVTLTAELRRFDNRAEIIERTFTREEVADDLDQLEQMEESSWNTYFASGLMPPLEFEL